MSDDLLARAEALDAADPLAHLRDRFLTPDGFDVVSYLDGNSLGRPLRAAAQLLDEFVREQWAGRLIRGWTDGWLDWPLGLGDRLGAVALGAAAGQVVVADSTTVLLYKLSRAAVDARPGRRKVVLDTDNFPTDRYVLEGIAAERGLTLVWIETDPATGVTPAQVAEVVDEDTALVLFSHVAYRSGWLADAPEINRIAHAAGALTLWDLSHSAGSVVVRLDDWGADLAVGCTYKYLNGGPGSPAFAYVRDDLQDVLAQPIQGWMGTADVFAMGPEYRPARGIRRFISGTPPIVGMLAMEETLAMIEEAGIAAIRAKSVALTSYAITVADEWLAPLGVTLASPTESEERGGHVTLEHPAMREVTARLWQQDVIPDYRDPGGLRLGLSPLSTSFEEVHRGLAATRDQLKSVLLERAGLA